MKHASIAKIGILSSFMIALLMGMSSAGSCGNVPTTISTLINGCIPINIINTQGSATANGFTVELGNFPITAFAGNFVVYNTISGNTAEAWAANNGLVWMQLPYPIAANTGANDVYAIGVNTANANFFTGGANGIGAAPNATSTCGQYDNGASVFTNEWNFCNQIPSGWGVFHTTQTATNVIISNGGYANTIASNFGNSANTVDMYANLLGGSTANVCAGFTTLACASGSDNVASFLVSGTGGASINCAVQSSGGFTQINSCQPAGLAIWSVSYQGTANYIVSYTPPPNVINTAAVPSAQENIGIAAQATGNPAQSLYWALYRVNPPNGIMPTIQYGAFKSTGATTLTITPNPVIYPSTSTLSASTVPATDVIEIMISGNNYGTNNVVCSGIGSCSATFNSIFGVGANSLPATFTINAFDTNSLTQSVQTLTVNKANTILALSSCSNSPLPFSCTTTGSQITTTWNAPSSTLYLGSNSVGTSNALSNTVSDTENSLYQYAYTFNSAGNGFYNSNSVNALFYGYVPLTVQNSTLTIQAAPPSNAFGNTHYPYKLTTPAVGNPPYNVIYSLSNSVTGGANSLLLSNIANITWIPPTNNPGGSTIFTATENQLGNSVKIGLNIPTNMVVLNNCAPAFNLTAENFTYFPLALFMQNTCWLSPPSNWILNTYTANTAGNVIDTAGTNTMTLPLNVKANYFTPTYSFNLTSAFGLSQNSLPVNAFKWPLSNTAAVAPYTREILNISTFDQHSFNSLVTTTSVIQTDLFNGWVIANQTSISSNVFKQYIAQSSFQNPPLSQTTITLSSTAASHFLAINNYCPGIINSGSYRSFSPYLVDLNGSLYTFNIYSGYGNAGNGDFMQVQDGISTATAIMVQQFKIQSTPFALALENGGSYAFKFYDSNCNLIYATNFSVWGNPITISIPINQTVPKLQLPNITVLCTKTPITMNTMNVACSGNDRNNIITSWNLSVYNVSVASGWVFSQAHNVAASSFSYTFNSLSNVSATRVIATAIAPGGIQYPYTFDFNTNSLQTGLGVFARAFLTLLFLLIGLGIGAAGESSGVIADNHMLSTTLMLEAFILALTYVIGLATFIPLAAVIILILFLIVIGVMVHRHEDGLI